MQLTVPLRTEANAGSFPVDPDDVARWLQTLDPLTVEADAHELYRGLKHSNRLHNDVDKRRVIVMQFQPVLHALHRQLSELSGAQPLPLTREFARSARLRRGLLREEAFAFKILICDSETPLAEDAQRAMQALAREAESFVHAYRRIPDMLMTEAHRLYALAERHDLLSQLADMALPSVHDHYRYLLLLSTADLLQQRTRQLPLVMDFLKTSASDILIEKQRSPDTLGYTDYAISLERGAHPEPAQSVLNSSQDDIRWFSVAPVLFRIHKQSPHANANSGSVHDSGVLERQSLARLHVSLARTRKRRLARCITHQPHSVVFGHKDICAYLLYQPSADEADAPSDWAITNLTLHGACLSNAACNAGLVQVGELVSITDPQTAARLRQSDDKTKVESTLAIVRWVHASGDEGICAGVEFLARTVLPVQVSRAAQANQADTDDISERALIIACKMQNKVSQTLLLPSYLYQPGERLLATQGARSRQVKLAECLQNNGLFSQYALVDGKA